MALELILRSLLNSKKFINSTSEEKDWQAISKLVPGTTPKQVCMVNVIIIVLVLSTFANLIYTYMYVYDSIFAANVEPKKNINIVIIPVLINLLIIIMLIIIIIK